MKRYYTSFLRYRIVMIIWPIVFTTNGVLTIIRSSDYEGFLNSMNVFIGYSMIAISVFAVIHIYNIYNKRVYFEINKDSMVYSFGRRKVEYAYEDAKYYIIRPVGQQRKIHIKSIRKNKMVKVSLFNFDIDYDEFIVLLSDYSGKEVYYKDYGGEPKLIEK